MSPPIIRSIEYLKPAVDIPYCHHERWDGRGYVQGLAGDDIPFRARIFTIIDVWDAMRSDRPYRKAISEKKTLAYIREESGKLFDPRWSKPSSTCGRRNHTCWHAERRCRFSVRHHN